MTSLSCIDLCDRSMFPHSASTKETAFSARRVCHKLGLAMHGRQPACQKLCQMRLPRSSQDSQDVNDEVQILTYCTFFSEVNHKEASLATCHHISLWKDSVENLVNMASCVDGRPQSSDIRLLIRQRIRGKGTKCLQSPVCDSCAP